ncbi:transcription termination factor Rho [Cellulomonas sp. Leaf334]|uniref:transcription termination factor Rho n=1 Tax=Cellulomonas sp. Leaf334 TaxID=1736339 RepID=UPI0006F232E1|nr:transcription termination factor Rho [Cellulomonas sp. Leaf334]KQR07709.1 transcription termination factor Rho [Cellulomonas sp. Leaf334]
MTDIIEPAVSTSGGSARSAGISALRLPELQAMASDLGVKGTSKMRKGDLVQAISDARAGSRPQALEPRRDLGREQSTAVADAPPARRARAPRTQAPQLDLGGDAAAAPTRESAQDSSSRAPRGDALAGLEAALDARLAPVEQRDDRAARAADAVGGVTGERRSRRAGRGAGAPQGDDADRGQTNGQQADHQQRDGQQRDSQQADRQQRDGQQRDGQQRDSQQRDPQQGNRQQGGAQQGGTQQQRREGDEDGLDERGGRRRRSRDRYRDRDRDRKGRGTRGRPGAGELAGLDDIEVTDDDVLLPVAGILDLMDSYAFVRTTGYLPSANDVYVSLNQVKRYGLRRGDAVTGAVRQPREGEQPPQGNRPSKFNALVRLDSVNGLEPDGARVRPEFNKLTPLYPQERLRLESEQNRLSPRVIDIVAPIGKGQRGLIVAPPKAGKTIIMQQIANAITTNNPEVHLMVVLVDERPEEVTDMERTVKGEVIASTFDRPASDHTIVAELAIERAKRLVELGQDVVVLLDSLTRLSRAYNLAAPASGRILSGGVDASALYPPKRFFGAARNIEHGGSLTILASALVETGSKMDEVIFEEFKGTGNMELRLSRSLADKRIFPAVDVNASGTRREEILMPHDELKIIYKLRRVMGALDQTQAIELLIGKLKDTKSNVEFLLQVQKTTPGSD